MAQRQSLIDIDIGNFQGLYTKTAPTILDFAQLRQCQNADFFAEYGAIRRVRGTSRVLSGAYTESATAKGIYWIGFYKAADLDGSIIRQTLIGAGTTIQKINSDGTLTSLQTSEPDALFRTHAMLDRDMYITSQDPNVVGNRGSKMLRYDGERMNRWGVIAPGSQETVIDDFDDASSWTATGATITDNTSITWSGDSIKMVKTPTSTSASMEILNIIPVFSINNVEEDRAFFRIFIPRTSYRTLNTNGRAVSVYIGSDGTLTTDYYRYDFLIGEFIEGWNTISIDFSVFPSGSSGTTVGSPDDSNLNAYRFEIVTNNASDTPTVYWDSFTELDQGNATTLTFTDNSGSTFAADGTWNYRYTFVTDNGVESNAGPSVAAEEDTSQSWTSIVHAGIPTSTAANVVKRRIYRTTNGGVTYFLVATLNDNTTTSYTDSTADTGLGSSQPPLAGDQLLDNSPPPQASIIYIWKRTAFLAGDPLNPTTLFFSNFDEPETFPILNAFTLDDTITGIYESNEGLVITTESDTWRVIGDNPDYFVERVIRTMGAVGMRAVGEIRTDGYMLDNDGLRLYDLRDTIKISEVIRDQIDNLNRSNLKDTWIKFSKKHNTLLHLHKDSSGDYTDNFKYDFAIDNPRQGWYSTLSLPSDIDLLCGEEIEDSNGDTKLYVGSDNGMVFELFADSADNWVNASGTETGISFSFRTKYMRLGPAAVEVEGVKNRVNPMFIELRINEPDSSAVNFTVLVETSDGEADNSTVRGSQSITFPFAAGSTLVRLRPKNLIGAEFIRFTISTSDTDVDPRVYGLKTWCNVRSGPAMVDGTNFSGRS